MSLSTTTGNDDPLRDALVSERLDDALVPGVVVVVTPEEAEDLGATEEPALSIEEAWESNEQL